MKRRRSPQEKKQLSYERDRRNEFGENDKASRKAIPLRKKLSNSKVRYAGKPLLAEESDKADALLAKAVKTRWKKHPDAALKKDVSRKLQRRGTATRKMPKSRT